MKSSRNVSGVLDNGDARESKHDDTKNPIINQLHIVRGENSAKHQDIKNGANSSLMDIFVNSRNSIKSLKPATTTRISTVSVAIGLALKYKPNTNVSEMAFFDLFLESFCRTASKGYQYHFYLGYDHTDIFFTQPNNREEFHARFNATVATNYTLTDSQRPALNWVVSDNTGEPARAQNDAMMAAYCHCHCDYYFRVVDDSILMTEKWTEALIAGLLSMEPANVGMVAPNITNAPKGLLTVEFVHRTHFEVFGYYYPYTFRQWWADTWMNHVYDPDHKKTVQQVKFIHLLSRYNNRARYSVDFAVKNVKYDEEALDKEYFNRYLVARKQHGDVWPPPADPKKVIGMSLSGNHAPDVQGALRNAHLLPVFFPGWTLRLYMPTQLRAKPSAVIPRYMLEKLRHAGVKIVEIDPTIYSFPPELFNWLALDAKDADYVLVRNVTSRLSDRDHIVVRAWMNTEPERAFQCIRDHPAFVNMSIVPGAFGARPRLLARLLGKPIHELLSDVQHRTDHFEFQRNVLDTAIWPRVKDQCLCHDSVSCTQWANSVPFPVQRRRSKKIQTEKETEFIPAAYNEHHRIAYDIAYDNEHWWKPFHREGSNQCNGG